MLLDEWQTVPGVLGAVKRAVDASPGAGRFLLTGSVSARLTADTWPGTGRVISMSMYGLTARETLGSVTGELFLDKLCRADIEQFAAPTSPPDLLGYVELALRGGFPEAALRLSAGPRRAWLEGYLGQLFTRDLRSLDEIRDPHRLRRYFEALALNTAGAAASKTLYDAAGVDRKTALAYERLLMNLFVLDVVSSRRSSLACTTYARAMVVTRSTS